MVGGCQLHSNTENKYRGTLKLGQVNFINCLPINLPIELGEVSINVKIINGVPSELNHMILKGDIDIAPISSLTYIENKDKLVPVADLCIASNGPADSVLLFSKFPIEELEGAKIALSNASGTSNRLLQVILKRFLNINCIFELSHLPSPISHLLLNYSAALLIGDHALLEFSKIPREEFFIYDLGSLWKKFTGLPMVFGIWVVRNEVLDTYPEEVSSLSQQLNQALELGFTTMFDKVIKKSFKKIPIPRDFYTTYFEHLSYKLNNEHIKGLNTFESLCKEVAKNLQISQAAHV